MTKYAYQPLFSIVPYASIEEDILPARIEVVLREVFPQYSRKVIAEHCTLGKILVNGRKTRKGKMLFGKEEIQFETLPEERIPSLKRSGITSDPNRPKLNCLYEDEFIVAINKPRGMHSVLQKEEDPLTVADLLADYLPALLDAGRDKKESGLVQRLDYWTSGIMLACKTKVTWEFLHEQFVSGQVTKTYLAEIEPPNGKIPDYEEGLRFELLETLPEKALLRVFSNDGSRHIVRKTLASMGYPLLGDKEYGSKYPGKGFMLHAESITFTHPTKGEVGLSTDKEDTEDY
jgi:23S rRNA pseudouridine1911/1915/1917 synthase